MSPKAKIYVVLVPAATMLLAAGCNQILNSSSYRVGDTSDAASENAADGCSATTQSRSQFEQACTSAECLKFDNARVYFLDGGAQRPLPAIPVPEAGPPPVDGGSDGAPSGNPPCSAIPSGGPSVYVTGSTALALFIGKIAAVLSGTTPPTASIIYQKGGSCAGVHAVIDPVPMVGTGIYYTPDGATHTCDLDPAGVVADVGISDVFATTCYAFSGGLPGGLPKNVQENFGPIQVMNFVVPATSSEVSISIEAARDVFGFGTDSRVAPWTDETLIFQRNANSGTQNMIAAALGVAPLGWKGALNAGSADMQKSLETAGKTANAGKAIGILASDFADEHRDTLKILALQDKGQACGYLPDLHPGTKEKQNVRDGHYPIWGPSHFYVTLNNGQPRVQAVRTFITDLSGITPLPGVDLLTLYANGHVIPTCAMHVQRQSDGADYTPYHPTQSCSCYYDSVVGNSTSACKVCSGNEDCPGQQCNKFGATTTGFCEPSGTDN